MKRIAAIVGATLATSVAISLASAEAAHAGDHDPPMTGCGGGYVGGALPTHLHYRSASWDIGTDPDDGTLAIAAPRAWSFVRTPAGEGRFHDPSGNDLLSLRTVTRAGTPATDMADQVTALAGTPGLRILGQHTKVVGNLGQRWSTLSYSYTSMGEPRRVKVRWIAFGTDPADEAQLVLTVGGRMLDGPGLDAMLGHVGPTVRLAG
jgi:hypothetical protein